MQPTLNVRILNQANPITPQEILAVKQGCICTCQRSYVIKVLKKDNGLDREEFHLISLSIFERFFTALPCMRRWYIARQLSTSSACIHLISRKEIVGLAALGKNKKSTIIETQLPSTPLKTPSKKSTDVSVQDTPPLALTQEEYRDRQEERGIVSPSDSSDSSCMTPPKKFDLSEALDVTKTPLIISASVRPSGLAASKSENQETTSIVDLAKPCNYRLHLDPEALAKFPMDTQECMQEIIKRMHAREFYGKFSVEGSKFEAALEQLFIDKLLYQVLMVQPNPVQIKQENERYIDKRIFLVYPQEMDLLAEQSQSPHIKKNSPFDAHSLPNLNLPVDDKRGETVLNNGREEYPVILKDNELQKDSNIVAADSLEGHNPVITAPIPGSQNSAQGENDHVFKIPEPRKSLTAKKKRLSLGKEFEASSIASIPSSQPQYRLRFNKEKFSKLSEDLQAHLSCVAKQVNGRTEYGPVIWKGKQMEPLLKEFLLDQQFYKVNFVVDEMDRVYRIYPEEADWTAEHNRNKESNQNKPEVSIPENMVLDVQPQSSNMENKVAIYKMAISEDHINNFDALSLQRILQLINEWRDNGPVVLVLPLDFPIMKTITKLSELDYINMTTDMSMKDGKMHFTFNPNIKFLLS